MANKSNYFLKLRCCNFFFYIKPLFLNEAHRFFLVLLCFRMFPPWKCKWKLHLFCFPHLCCFNECWEMEKETALVIYIPTFAHRKKSWSYSQDFWSGNFKGGCSNRNHSSFSAGFTTNQCAVTPQPCKYWHICLVSKRMEIMCLERGDSQAHNKAHSKVWTGSKTWAVISWHPLGPNLIIFTPIY